MVSWFFSSVKWRVSGIGISKWVLLIFVGGVRKDMKVNEIGKIEMKGAGEAEIYRARVAEMNELCPWSQRI